MHQYSLHTLRESDLVQDLQKRPLLQSIWGSLASWCNYGATLPLSLQTFNKSGKLSQYLFYALTHLLAFKIVVEHVSADHLFVALHWFLTPDFIIKLSTHEPEAGTTKSTATTNLEGLGRLHHLLASTNTFHLSLALMRAGLTDTQQFQNFLNMPSCARKSFLSFSLQGYAEPHEIDAIHAATKNLEDWLRGWHVFSFGHKRVYVRSENPSAMI